MIHTDKRFRKIDEAKVIDLLVLRCFLYNPANTGYSVSASSENWLPTVRLIVQQIALKFNLQSFFQ